MPQINLLKKELRTNDILKGRMHASILNMVLDILKFKTF